jgi:bifunctional DNA primase/polymerase-like protein/uncharacterized protein DUF2637
MNVLLDAALGYAARGIPVYPVHWPRPTLSEASLACSCSRGPVCDRPAKHPLVRHGIHDATTDPAQLERWWQRWPQANLGLATGIVFDALDVDGPAGLDALRNLARAADLRLPGPLVATGGGGWHHWFAPTGLGNRPPHGLAHIDWRGTGGCVLATSQAPPTAGCATSTGRRYPRSRPPCAPCSPPTDQQPPGRPTRPGRPHSATGTAARSWPANWPPWAGLPPATATAPSTLVRSRSTATSPQGCSMTTKSLWPSPPWPWPSASTGPRSAARWPRPAPPAWPTPHRPGRTRPQQPGGRVMTGRWTYRTSAAGVQLLAGAAFTLSYDALHQLALDSRVRPALAWLWPVVIDGTIVVALLTVLAAKRAAAKAGYPWALPGCSPWRRSPSTSPTPQTGRSPSWCSPWPRSPWCSPPTYSCSRLAGAGRRPPARTNRWPHIRPAPNPHTRTRRAITPHPCRPVWTGAHKWAHGPGSGRPTRPKSRPGRPRPAPAWPGRRA